MEAQRRCDAGAVSACAELGRILVARTDNPRDVERGAVLLDAACARNDFPSCAVLAASYAERANDSRGLARAHELASRACHHGVAEGCTTIGQIVLRVDPREQRRAAQAFHTGCERGDPVGCALYGTLKWDGQVAADRAEAERAFAAGCRLGHRLTCHLLAMAQLANPETSQQATELLLSNCNRLIIESCSLLALMAAPVISLRPSCKTAVWYAERACAVKDAAACAIRDACMLDVAKEAPAALARLRTACETSNGLACFYWADAEERRSGPPDADPERVRSAYEAGCKHSERMRPLEQAACVRLAVIDLPRAATDSEAVRLVSVLQKWCDDSSGEACCALADASAAGKWVPADAAAAAGLRDRACGLGAQRCCAGGGR